VTGRRPSGGRSPYRSAPPVLRAARVARVRVAWSWARGRLMRYGRARLGRELRADRAFVPAVATSAATMAVGASIYFTTGLWFLVLTGALLLVWSLASGIFRRVFASRHRPSLRARGYRGAGR
jgi:hypothetical protein